MSYPSEGRVLPLPLFAGGNRAHSRRLPESSEPQTPSRIEDHELMAQLQVPDSNALELLFDRYSRLVYHISARLLRDHAEAEDALQDTFLYLYRRAELFDPLKGSAKAWIVQVAAHRALDRKLRRNKEWLFFGTEIDAVDDTLLAPTDLDREVGAKLVRAQLERAFAELPEAQRRTLAMFYFEGLELREIAEKQDEALGNIRHHYYRGLERLRKSAFVGRLWKDHAK